MTRIGLAEKSETEKIIFAKVAEVYGNRKNWAQEIGAKAQNVAPKVRAINGSIKKHNGLLAPLGLEFVLIEKK